MCYLCFRSFVVCGAYAGQSGVRSIAIVIRPLHFSAGQNSLSAADFNFAFDCMPTCACVIARDARGWSSALQSRSQQSSFNGVRHSYFRKYVVGRACAGESGVTSIAIVPRPLHCSAGQNSLAAATFNFAFDCMPTCACVIARDARG